MQSSMAKRGATRQVKQPVVALLLRRLITVKPCASDFELSWYFVIQGWSRGLGTKTASVQPVMWHYQILLILEAAAQICLVLSLDHLSRNAITKMQQTKKDGQRWGNLHWHVHWSMKDFFFHTRQQGVLLSVICCQVAKQNVPSNVESLRGDVSE